MKRSGIAQEYFWPSLTIRRNPGRARPILILGKMLFPALAVIGIAFPSDLLASECRSSTAPKVAVEVRRDEVREVVDSRRDELGKLAAALGRPELLPLFGRYEAAFGYRVDVDSIVERSEAAAFCATPTLVHIAILVTHRVVHLAQEALADPCLLESTRAHEALHAHADELAIDEGVSPFLEEMRKAMRQPPTTTAPSAATARAEFLSAVSREVEKQFTSIEEVRRRLNRSIDAPANIAELHASCSQHGLDTL